MFVMSVSRVSFSPRRWNSAKHNICYWFIHPFWVHRRPTRKFRVKMFCVYEMWDVPFNSETSSMNGPRCETEPRCELSIAVYLVITAWGRHQIFEFRFISWSKMQLGFHPDLQRLIHHICPMIRGHQAIFSRRKKWIDTGTVIRWHNVPVRACGVNEVVNDCRYIAECSRRSRKFVFHWSYMRTNRCEFVVRAVHSRNRYN